MRLQIRFGSNLGPSFFESKLGPLNAKLDEKSGTRTQNKAKRTNQIDFLMSLCKQGVAGSIPATSTNHRNRPRFIGFADSRRTSALSRTKTDVTQRIVPASEPLLKRTETVMSSKTIAAVVLHTNSLSACTPSEVPRRRFK